MARRREWVATRMAELCRGLNHPHPMSLTTKEIERFWKHWETTTAALKAVRSEEAEDAAIRPLMVNSIRPALGGRRSAALAWVPTPEGYLVVGGKRPSALALLPAAELIDYARKSGAPRRVFLRLRRCARSECRRFFDDVALRAARHPSAYNSDKCRMAARTAQRKAPSALQKTARRVKRYRERHGDMDGP